MTHIVNGHFINQQMTLVLPPDPYRIAIVDLVNNINVFAGTSDEDKIQYRTHIETCVNNFIAFANSSTFIMQLLRMNGVVVCSSHKLHYKLEDFFIGEDIKMHSLTNDNLTHQEIKGIFWIGIHGEICVAKNILDTHHSNQRIRHYLLEDCIHTLRTDGDDYAMHLFCNWNWHFATLLDTTQLTIESTKL